MEYWIYRNELVRMLNKYSLDEFVKFIERYKKEDEMFNALLEAPQTIQEITMNKLCACIPDIRNDVRVKAKRWLKENNYREMEEYFNEQGH